MVSHYCFAMGDLNFRTNFDDEIFEESHIESSRSEGESETEPQSTVQKRMFRYPSSSENTVKQRHLEMGHKLAANKDWEALYAADELIKGIRQGEVFHGFVTPKCNFNPTFKVTKGMREYKYNPKRTPSYTDRILYKTCNGYERKISTDAYHPCADFITSDHKPIRGAFSFTTVASTKSADNDLEAEKFFSFAMATMRKMRGNQPTKHYFIISLTKMSCSNLPVMDTGPKAKADPYIKLVVNTEKLLKKINMKGFLCKTISWPKSSMLEYTLDPVWKDDEVVEIQLKFDHPRKLIGSILFITVMDWDLASEDDLIGTLQLDLMTLYEKYTKGITSIDINGPLVKCAKTGRGMLACTLKMEIK